MTQLPIKLTPAEVKANARKAYAEGRLVMQDPTADRCVYRSTKEGKTYCCAIGASLPDDLDWSWALSGGMTLNGSSYTTLVQDRIVNPPDSLAEFNTINKIQGAHDSCVGDLQPAQREERTAKFLELIAE